MTGASSGLAPALYLRPDAFVRERRHLFNAVWLLLGRSAQLQQTGDYICASLAGWPAIALRDEAGALLVCLNACRHQGLPILDNGTGRVEHLRCRYHGWVYDLAGQYVAAPGVMAPPEPENPMNQLARLAYETWQGLLFVHFGKSWTPFGETLALPALDGLHHHSEIGTDVDANWKLVMEHGLAGGAPGMHWQWPTLLCETRPDGVILQQVIPRTFQRTRVVRHVFVAEAPDEARAAGMAEAQSAVAEAAKAACEQAQAALAAGTPPLAIDILAQPETPALSAFRTRLRAVHPEETGNA
jgi:phenylpropionate dioxygenase-like ring-hydroxylating dioxygenase large terminal subunit